MMTGNDIRKRFLAFFASKHHTVVASDSLVPKDDPTVLFTTAGMQQFKRQFLGHIDGFTRACSSQKCLRTDDLNEVGKTDFHHTFFEMLGNFSFGDYFKKEAIAWAWEFLTDELKIDPKHLWVSVYQDDAHAEDIWHDDIRIDPKKIVKLGDKSNFWPANAKEKGPNGPCGPCSEIFYDYGANPNCASAVCDPSCDCGRFSEIWNLVFTQFDRKEGGVLTPLPNKNIDTGMGLERLAAVLQGKKNNFETDLFAPIIQAVRTLDPDKKYISLTETRVIADHLRAVVFGIADGVIPSNEGRGYVIKRLIIDMTDIALKTGVSSPVIYQLAPSVVQAMGDPYPELADKMNDIMGIINQVERAYIKVRTDRLPELKSKVTGAIDHPVELGQLMFTYRDTFGLTVPTILNVFDEVGVRTPQRLAAETEFTRLMEHQQRQSRASSKMTGDVFSGTDLRLDVPKTKFTGYSETHGSATVLALFNRGESVQEIGAGDSVEIVLNQTPFYAESGGQIGDTGYITRPDARVLVSDTKKVDDVFIHSGIVETGILRVHDPVQARIDVERRLAIMRNHTATHLLQAALRQILGTHIQQQGSLVAPDRLRFDFTHHKAITPNEQEEIERYVNERVLRCHIVTKEILPIDEAKKSGALAFFAEKYGSQVRVVSIDGYSKEFCGGTHLDSTGQIGLFKITGECAIAQGIRRLEAKTGNSALTHVFEEEQQLQQIAQILKAPATDLVERLNGQSRRIKEMEKEIAQYKFQAAQGKIDNILASAESLHGSKIISYLFHDMDMALLRQISDTLKQKAKSAVIVLGASTQDTASILLAVTDDLIKKGIRADELIRDIAPLIHGSGGGRPSLAQAGSREPQKIERAIQQANVIIKNKVSA